MGVVFEVEGVQVLRRCLGSSAGELKCFERSAKFRFKHL